MSHSIMERLKEDTKTAHQQLEKATIPFIRRSTNNEHYELLLKMFYGYFRPMEEKIQKLVPESLLQDIGERRQTVALLNDLKKIGAETASLELSAHLPELKTVAQAIGALYVLEGSTLGGRFISQMLMNQLERPATEGISFFSGYGDQTDAKWKLFTETVNHYAAQHPEQTDEMVKAADETFAAFGRWVAAYQESIAQPA